LVHPVYIELNDVNFYRWCFVGCPQPLVSLPHNVAYMGLVLLPPPSLHKFLSYQRC